MRRISMAATGLAVLASVACILAGPAFAGTHPPDRHGFMIGFGVGGASLGVENRGGHEGGVTGNFRIGYAVRPDLVIHYEGTAWTRKTDEILGETTWTFATSTAALTYYSPSTRIFLRGGIGFGIATLDVETAGVHISRDETGLGLLAAVGYEWRLSKKFAMAPQLDFAYQDLDSLGSANSIGGSLGFNWYW